MKVLWQEWNIGMMMSEAIKNVEKHWLNPTRSFAFENKSDYQLDFPMTAKAFLFRCFSNIVGVPLNNNTTKNKLLRFYA